MYIQDVYLGYYYRFGHIIMKLMEWKPVKGDILDLNTLTKEAFNNLISLQLGCRVKTDRFDRN